MAERSHELTPAAAAFAEYLALHEAGEAPSFEAFCAERIALAPKLRRLHARWRELSGALGGDALLASADPGISLEGEGPPLPAGGSADRYADRELVARGGMGEIRRVWDRDLRRSLAMKVLLDAGNDGTPGATPRSDPRSLSRFLEEAQITAQLDHPGIVPVHELGLDANGRVYFTMALIRGRSLKEIFKLAENGEEGWTRTRVLNALLRVCEAVAYAHQRGVIHRDLKPANVMVGRFGETYVMDWGLARVLGRDDRRDIRLRSEPGASLSSIATVRSDAADLSDSPLVTMDGDVVGTPAYMPPEQARGETERIGPQADVYAIGAMLYHLLSGRMPYVPPDSRITSRTVLARVLDGPPPPLHTIASDVPAELAAICGKAMERQPQDRYANVVELAEDLRAYLEQRVVHAYETGAWAELRKWVGRNKALAASAAAAVLALALGLVFSLVQKDRADTNAERAEANFKLAFAAIDKMLTRVGQEKLKNVPQMETVRRDLLQEAVTLLETLQAQDDDPAMRGELAKGLSRAGRMHWALGDYREAVKLIEREMALLETHTRDNDDDLEALWGLVISRENLGSLHCELSEPEQGLELLRAAKDLADAIAPRGVPPGYDGVYINLRNNYAGALHRAGRSADGLEVTRETVRQLQQKLDADPENEALQLQVAETTVRIAWGLEQIGEVEASAASYPAALAVFAQMVERHPEGVEHRYRLQFYRNAYAAVLTDLRRAEEARGILEEVVDAVGKLTAEFPNTADYPILQGGALSNLGGAWWSLDDKNRAIAFFERAIEVERRALAIAPENTTARQFLINQYCRLGSTLVELGNYESAMTRCDELAALPFADRRARTAVAHFLAGSAGLAAADRRDDLAEACRQRSLAALAQAVELGFANARLLEHEWFDSVRERPEFVALAARVAAGK